MSNHLEWARHQYPELASSEASFLVELVEKNVDYVRGLLAVGSLFLGVVLLFLLHGILDVILPPIGIGLPGWVVSAIVSLIVMLVINRLFSIEDRLIRRSIQRELSATHGI